MTLTEFLHARIAEDEAVARSAVGMGAFSRQTGRWMVGHPRDIHGQSTIVFALTDSGARTQAADLTLAWESAERARHIALHDPARVLAECEAKRRIAEMHREGIDADCVLDCDDHMYGPCNTLRALALPFAEHPDYDEAWRL